MRTNTNIAYAQHLWGMHLLHMAAGRDPDFMGDLVALRLPDVLEREALDQMVGNLGRTGFRLHSVHSALIAMVRPSGGLWTVEHRVFEDYPYIEINGGAWGYFDRWVRYWWEPVVTQDGRGRARLKNWVRRNGIRVATAR